ncbi:MAG: ATP-binding protein [Geodermatophilaceae bacterium]|nr:ATP-binding protein [Geodermatophilaceae bacterium]
MTTSLRTPPPRVNGAAAAHKPAKTFNRTRGVQASAIGILVYGTGGIGKSSLSAMAPDPLVLDLERSTDRLDVERIDNIETWGDLRSFLQGDNFAGVGSIVIDSATAAEDFCRQHIIENVKTEKGATVTSIEGYGWGKGYVHLFEEWRKLLADLDAHRRRGRNVVLICHEQIGKVPNPSGDDYIRYQPRLYTGNQVSLLHPTKEWADEVLFISYDVAAADGKAKGSGTRTIYSVETATHMAKTRSLDGTPMEFQKGDDSLWRLLKSQPVTDEIPG